MLTLVRHKSYLWMLRSRAKYCSSEMPIPSWHPGYFDHSAIRDTHNRGARLHSGKIVISKIEKMLVSDNI